MSRLNLTSWQRRRLRRQLAETREARLFRKTLAVLEFDHGRSAADIARMLFPSDPVRDEAPPAAVEPLEARTPP